MKGRYAPGAYTKAKERIAELEEHLRRQYSDTGGSELLIQNVQLQARIAELEAELAKVRQHFTVCPEHEYILRAEKAEAEVERLRGELTLALEAQKVPFPAEWCLLHGKIDSCSERGVNPSGDTLGGGGRESGTVSPVDDDKAGGVREASSAAANPAARKERDDG